MRPGRKRGNVRRLRNGRPYYSPRGIGEDGQAAVYVVEINDGIPKIGYSVAPATRVADLQVGQPHPIRLVACFWLSRDQARKVELLVHKKLRNDVRRLRGEIYCFNSEEAERTINTAMVELGIDVPKKPLQSDVGHSEVYWWPNRIHMDG